MPNILTKVLDRRVQLARTSDLAAKLGYTAELTHEDEQLLERLAARVPAIAQILITLRGIRKPEQLRAAAIQLGISLPELFDPESSIVSNFTQQFAIDDTQSTKQDFIELEEIAPQEEETEIEIVEDEEHAKHSDPELSPETGETPPISPTEPKIEETILQTLHDEVVAHPELDTEQKEVQAKEVIADTIRQEFVEHLKRTLPPKTASNYELYLTPVLTKDLKTTTSQRTDHRKAAEFLRSIATGEVVITRQRSTPATQKLAKELPGVETEIDQLPQLVANLKTLGEKPRSRLSKIYLRLYQRRLKKLKTARKKAEEAPETEATKRETLAILARQIGKAKLYISELRSTTKDATLSETKEVGPQETTQDEAAIEAALTRLQELKTEACLSREAFAKAYREIFPEIEGEEVSTILSRAKNRINRRRKSFITKQWRLYKQQYWRDKIASPLLVETLSASGVTLKLSGSSQTLTQLGLKKLTTESVVTRLSQAIENENYLLVADLLKLLGVSEALTGKECQILCKGEKTQTTASKTIVSSTEKLARISGSLAVLTESTEGKDFNFDSTFAALDSIQFLLNRAADTDEIIYKSLVSIADLHSAIRLFNPDRNFYLLDQLRSQHQALKEQIEVAKRIKEKFKKELEQRYTSLEAHIDSLEQITLEDITKAITSLQIPLGENAKSVILLSTMIKKFIMREFKILFPGAPEEEINDENFKIILSSVLENKTVDINIICKLFLITNSSPSSISLGETGFYLTMLPTSMVDNWIMKTFDGYDIPLERKPPKDEIEKKKFKENRFSLRKISGAWNAANNGVNLYSIENPQDVDLKKLQTLKNLQEATKYWISWRKKEISALQLWALQKLDKTKFTLALKDPGQLATFITQYEEKHGSEFKSIFSQLIAMGQSFANLDITAEDFTQTFGTYEMQLQAVLDEWSKIHKKYLEPTSPTQEIQAEAPTLPVPESTEGDPETAGTLPLPQAQEPQPPEAAATPDTLPLGQTPDTQISAEPETADTLVLEPPTQRLAQTNLLNTLGSATLQLLIHNNTPQGEDYFNPEITSIALQALRSLLINRDLSNKKNHQELELLLQHLTTRKLKISPAEVKKIQRETISGYIINRNIALLIEQHGVEPQRQVSGGVRSDVTTILDRLNSKTFQTLSPESMVSLLGDLGINLNLEIDSDRQIVEDILQENARLRETVTPFVSALAELSPPLSDEKRAELNAFFNISENGKATIKLLLKTNLPIEDLSKQDLERLIDAAKSFSFYQSLGGSYPGYLGLWKTQSWRRKSRATASTISPEAESAHLDTLYE